jgi:hypothetical protein
MGSLAARGLMLLAATIAAPLAACGEPSAPPPAGGPPRYVRVEGPPFKMGEQLGKALRAEIAEAVGPRLRTTLRAAAIATGATEEFLKTACRAYASQMREFLPESVKEELRGLAAGSGQSEEDLFLLDVVREGLRWHGAGARMLEAAFASPPRVTEPMSVFAAYQGFDEEGVEGRLVVVDRQDGEGKPTIVLTWPGSLGALAGSTPGLWAVQSEVGLDVRRGSLKGPPFAIGLRVALERATSLEDFWQRLPKLSGNRVLAAASGENKRRSGLVAYAGDDPVDHDLNEWVLAPAGVGGPDSPLTQQQDVFLGAFATRPGPPDAVPLAIAGRSAAGRGPIVGVGFRVIEWSGRDDADGTSPPVTYLLDTDGRAPSPLRR